MNLVHTDINISKLGKIPIEILVFSKYFTYLCIYTKVVH